MPPTRRQKRWSGRLRTAGALLSLLGAVAVVDAVVGLASPSSPLSPVERTRLPWVIGWVLLGLGAVVFALGRRWR